MSAGLSVNDVVNVSVSLNPIAAATRNFGNLLLLGTSGVIDGTERLRLYTSAAAVGVDFGQSAPEYLAALIFFSQSPTPAQLYIGSWLYAATPGILHGATLPAASQASASWTGITTGSVQFTIDGTLRSLAALNFSAVGNMNGVAAVINAALAANGSCTWDAVRQRLDVKGISTGPGTKASGTVTFAGQPTAGDTLTIAGTAITFVASGPVGNQVLIGASATATAANLLAFLAASIDVNLVKCTYALNTAQTILTVTAVSGVAAVGNALTLAKVSTNLTVSGATLSGGVNAGSVSYGSATGSGVDITALGGFSQAAGAAIPVPGYPAETAASAVTTLANLSNDWYGLYIAATQKVVSDDLAVAALIEAASPSRIYGLTTQDSNVLVSTASNDIASLLKALNYKRTFSQYSSGSAYAGISIFGRAFTVNFNGANTTITVKFKVEPGVAAETLSESQAQTATSKNCNVFVNYSNSTAIIQQGVMANGYFFDEVHGLDWFQNRVQTDVYNLLYQSPTKIPQTDAGVNQIVTTVQSSCAAGANNGLFGPGVWTGDPVGPLATGQTLTNGYFVFANPIASQNSADRAARIAPTIQVAAKLAGAVHFANVVVNVNR